MGTINEKRMSLLERAAKRGKYAPLYVYLKQKQGALWRVNFAELEKLLGFTLPDSARIHRPWWANQGIRSGHSQAVAWEMAGWKTANVDMMAETLTFQKSGMFGNGCND
jgi:hypothetical protein